MRRLRISAWALTSSGLGGAPTSTRVPSVFRKLSCALRSCAAETVSMMRSKRPASFAVAAASEVSANSSAPRRVASACLDLEPLNTVTSAPIAAAIFTAMCPSPPRPSTPTRWPLPIFQRFSGE